MLIWGAATVTKKIGESPTFECRTCKTTAPHSLIQSYKWGHLWYLGTIMERAYYSVCNTCQTTDKLDNVKTEKSIAPKYPFNQQYGWIIWIALVGLVGLVGVVSDYITRGNTANFLSDPWAGDVYAVDTVDLTSSQDEFHFALLRVTSVQPAEIEFQPSTVMYDRNAALTKAIKDQSYRDGYFSTGFVVVSRKKLDEMSSKGHIFQIQRRPGSVPTAK